MNVKILTTDTDTNNKIWHDLADQLLEAQLVSNEPLTMKLAERVFPHQTYNTQAGVLIAATERMRTGLRQITQALGNEEVEATEAKIDKSFSERLVANDFGPIAYSAMRDKFARDALGALVSKLDITRDNNDGWLDEGEVSYLTKKAYQIGDSMLYWRGQFHQRDIADAASTETEA